MPFAGNGGGARYFLLVKLDPDYLRPALGQKKGKIANAASDVQHTLPMQVLTREHILDHIQPQRFSQGRAE